MNALRPVEQLDNAHEQRGQYGHDSNAHQAYRQGERGGHQHVPEQGGTDCADAAKAEVHAGGDNEQDLRHPQDSISGRELTDRVEVEAPEKAAPTDPEDSPGDRDQRQQGQDIWLPPKQLPSASHDDMAGCGGRAEARGGFGTTRFLCLEGRCTFHRTLH